MTTLIRLLLCCLCLVALRTDKAVRVYHQLRRTSRYTPMHRRTFDYDRIDRYVLLGRQPRHEEDVQALRNDGVSAVLCFCQPWELYVPDDVYRNHSMARLTLPTCDFDAPTSEQLRNGLAFITNRCRFGAAS